jgi:predicted acylesterase/phospholipase RssA
MYLVVGGRLEVVRDDIVVEELTSGAALGELALLTGAPRAASVRARRDSDLLRISATAFDAVLATDPAATRRLAAGLATRLQRAAPVAAAAPAAPQLLAVGGLHPGAPVDQVAAALVSGMGPDDTAWLRTEPTPEALERLEADHRRVLLSAPADDAARTRRALAHADRQVLVAASSFDPASLEPDAVPAGAELVLVGPPPSADRISAWADREPWAITVGGPATLASDLGATARRLAGTSIGLVLAGGGARAFSHLGVLAELAESGVVVDRVAGCSIGAVVAALHAAGYSAEEATSICYAEFVRRNPFADYTVPTVSLSRGRRHRRLIDQYLGGHRIEALPRQFRAVSTDLLGREPVAHRTGDLGVAVKASLSLPVLFPPLRDGSRLLVDGGVLDNLPVGLLIERAEGPVVAVNISMGGGSGKRREGPPRMPGLGDTLLRTMMIGSGGANATAARAGIPVVTPPTLGVGLLEFHQLDRMVEAGRMAGRHLLETLGPGLQVRPAASSAD